MNIGNLRGINEKRAKDFKRLGATDTADLVRLFPRAYLDMTNRARVRELFHNDTALVACRLVSVEPVRYTGRVKLLRAWLEQDGDTFSAVWFNMPYLAPRLKAGEYLFYGRVQNRYGQVSLVNPSFEPIDRNARLKGLVPVYRLSGSLTQRVVRDGVSQALRAESFHSIIPPELQKKYALSPLKEAFYAVHAPKTREELLKASDRIALEEYFMLLSAFKLIKGDKNEARLRRYSVTGQEVAEFEKRFAFTFTDGQQAAVRDIYNNLVSPVRMNRLLQGDVGSGKTAVALTGIFMAVKSGFQAVYLSPTEVLAAQNYALLQRIFPEYRVGYLAGGSPAKEKREIKEALAAGEIDILCGTHAVLQSDVRFQNLAFCVCDEQHRFGVAQRNILSEKGENIDVLVMSATPIPRTLSLIFYGDLDITTIKDKPRERQEISTSLIPERKYDDMLEYVRNEVHQGKQAYFVCAKIDDDEGQVTSVTELFEELRGRLPDVRFALLHGRMKEKEKSEVMEAFKRKEYDCLVSTTVIEVGIDVPSATIMIIYNAERFGLSQLHQLRGRVGRGSEKSWCFLLVGGGGETALERLGVLKSTTDGFKLAEKDLELRGSGDFLGTRQSGKFLSDIKNLRYSTEVIFLAKKLTDEAFERRLNFEEIKRVSMLKYENLKDVVLN
ncbi:MAG: ATP-dependent DNA helicase RecG [Clostridia bacterium]|nr:ATP-dependent DNA helicase RecG [Clostridia bacterium]